MDSDTIAGAAGFAGSPPLSEMFTLLFLTLGPFKLIAPFAKATHGLSRRREFELAGLAVLFASATLILAGFLGDNMLVKYKIPLPILAFAGGLILFLSALLGVLQQGAQAEPEVSRPPEGSLLRLAMTPLAFPVIVTPYGVAALVVFLALAPDAAGQASIAGVVAGIMAANLVVMALTRPLFPALSLVLPILGAVLGVVQVALGLNIMYVSARALLSI